MTEDSGILEKDDNKWPEASRDNGRQELEVRIGNKHINFTCSKINSFVSVADSDDPEGLSIFYYLVQDLKCMIFSLISFHFKVKPI